MPLFHEPVKVQSVLTNVPFSEPQGGIYLFELDSLTYTIRILIMTWDFI